MSGGGEDFLVAMAAASAERARRARAAAPERELLAQIRDREPARELQLEGFDVIAEIKRRSPALGELSAADDLEQRALGYQRAGAAAISVLTEPTRFDGELEHLRRVVDAGVSVPVMRKDFLVEPYQLFEARAAGADMVLLIADMLRPELLVDMLGCARDLGLTVLLEWFSPELLERLAPRCVGARTLIGINCRDLRSLQVDRQHFARCARHLPGDSIRVAESGIEAGEDAAEVAGLGYGIILVGGALMQAQDPGQRIADLLRAGREAQCSSR